MSFYLMLKQLAWVWDVGVTRPFPRNNVCRLFSVVSSPSSGDAWDSLMPFSLSVLRNLAWSGIPLALPRCDVSVCWSPACVFLWCLVCPFNGHAQFCLHIIFHHFFWLLTCSVSIPHFGCFFSISDSNSDSNSCIHCGTAQLSLSICCLYLLLYLSFSLYLFICMFLHFYFYLIHFI